MWKWIKFNLNLCYKQKFKAFFFLQINFLTPRFDVKIMFLLLKFSCNLIARGAWNGVRSKKSKKKKKILKSKKDVLFYILVLKDSSWSEVLITWKWFSCSHSILRLRLFFLKPSSPLYLKLKKILGWAITKKKLGSTLSLAIKGMI